MANKKRYGFVIDVSRCIDCRACLVSCSVENNVPMNHTRIWVKDLGVQGEFPNLSHSFVPYNCMHCENPPCVEVCVSGATYKDPTNGLVLVDQEACIGCGFCVEACPYDARYLDESRGVVDKCTGCIQRVEAGQEPACVATCVGGSRLFGDLNDPESEVSKALKNAKTIQRLDYEKDGHDTDPNIYYINGDVLESGLAPRDPRYTVAETGWKKVLVPAIFAGIGASFLVQGTYFTKQLIEGEKEFDE
ncbi:MAG: 4Fe-4S dicluster domain-containing protein [Anaerolineales bacterium]|jgi:tetrathionate reductase subunit B